MTRHPSFEQIRAFADGDPDTSADRIASHVAECVDCHELATFTRRILIVAREDFTPASPAGSLEQILSRRAAGERRILPAVPAYFGSSTTRPRLPAYRIARWAAVLVLGAAGVAAALPGSLVRVWLVRQFSRGSVAVRTEVPAGAPATAPTTTPPAPFAGISIPVGAGEYWVAIDGANKDLRIRLRLTERNELEVRGVGVAARATFQPRPNGIGVTGAGSGELQIDVPQTLEHFVLRVAGVVYVTKEGSRLRVLAPGIDTLGTELLFSPRR